LWRTLTLLLLIGAIIAALPMIPETSLNRLASIGQEASSGTLTGRTTIWKYGLLAWQEQPLFGHGLGAFRKVVNPFSISESAHNTFISLLVETGLIGFMLFTGFLAMLLRLFGHVPEKDRSFQMVLIGSLLLTQMSTEWSMEKIAWILYGLLISHAWLETRQPERQWQIHPAQNIYPRTGVTTANA
jgi:O-antigen ligase